MARIFISFLNAIKDPVNPHAMPCFYEGFIQNLHNLGNSLLIHSHQAFHQMGDICPPSLLSQIKAFSPELIIIFNNCFYDISKEFSCPIIIYEVDSILYYANKDKIKEKPHRYKFIVPQTDSINTIQSAFGINKKNILYIPFFSAIQAEKKIQDIDISFIGSKFTSPGFISPWNTIQKEEATENEKYELINIMHEIERNPFLKKDDIIKKCGIMSEKIKSICDPDTFIWALSDAKRIGVLSEIADLGLRLYGTKNWGTDIITDPDLCLAYDCIPTYSLSHNQNIYNRSKLSININHLQATTGFSWRVCDIMASSACLVSEFRPDFKRLFPQIPFLFFEDKYEAREICIKILKEENLREDLVCKSQEMINKHFRLEHFLDEIEFFAGVRFSRARKDSSAVKFSEECSPPTENISVINETPLMDSVIPFTQASPQITRKKSNFHKRIELSLYGLLLFFSFFVSSFAPKWANKLGDKITHKAGQLS